MFPHGRSFHINDLSFSTLSFFVSAIKACSVRPLSHGTLYRWARPSHVGAMGMAKGYGRMSGGHRAVEGTETFAAVLSV